MRRSPGPPAPPPAASAGGRAQGVAGAPQRLDEDRLSELAAQVADVDLDEVVVERVAPEAIEDRLLGEDLAGGAGKGGGGAAAGSGPCRRRWARTRASSSAKWKGFAT